MAAKRKTTLAERADRHRLYEQSVQSPETECEFLAETFRALRRRSARVVREDFCGTAIVACEWARRHRANEAIGVDLDPEVLAWARTHNLAGLTPGQQARVRLIEADVRTVRIRARVDAVLAMNFSYWFFRSRPELLGYFRAVHRGLVPDGVFFLDAFGGYDSYRPIREKTDHGKFTYVWNQTAFDPISAECDCHIDFRFPDGSALKRAFSYRWRLWSLPEIRELLLEAGFSRATVYWQGTDERTGEGNGIFTPAERGEPDPGWIAYVVAEK